jgi:hypothetical protein
VKAAAADDDDGDVMTDSAELCWLKLAAVDDVIVPGYIDRDVSICVTPPPAADVGEDRYGGAGDQCCCCMPVTT